MHDLEVSDTKKLALEIGLGSAEIRIAITRQLPRKMK